MNALTLRRNAIAAAVAPTLSVLIPFFRSDPTVLIGLLSREAAVQIERFEIILLDDGSNDSDLTARVEAAVAAALPSTTLVTLARNVGRAAARNLLAGHARGTWLLFLDSDMQPGGPDFLRNWLETIRTLAPMVAFGGLALNETPARTEYALHYRIASASECMPAATRARFPEKHVFTSNLLVHRDVFAAERFDEDFVGWGWEDVEWALRVTRRWPIVHVDNRAVHLGMDTAETLITKCDQSATNFRRIIGRHAEAVRRFPSYHAARLAKLIPLRARWGAWARSLVLSQHVPIPVRMIALKFYRAAQNAEVV